MQKDTGTLKKMHPLVTCLWYLKLTSVVVIFVLFFRSDPYKGSSSRWDNTNSRILVPENFPNPVLFHSSSTYKYFIVFSRFFFFSTLGKVICASARHTGSSAKIKLAFKIYFMLYRLLKTNVVSYNLNKFWENAPTSESAKVENSYVRMRIKLNPVFECMKRVINADKWVPY